MTKKIDSGELVVKLSRYEAEMLEDTLRLRLTEVQNKFPDTNLPGRVAIVLKKLTRAKEAWLAHRRIVANAANTRRRREAAEIKEARNPCQS